MKVSYMITTHSLIQQQSLFIRCSLNMSTENTRTVRKVYIKILLNPTQETLQLERKDYHITFIVKEDAMLKNTQLEGTQEFGCLHFFSSEDETNKVVLFEILTKELPFAQWKYLYVEALPLPDRLQRDKTKDAMDEKLLERFPSHTENDPFYSKSEHDVKDPATQEVVEQEVKQKLRQLMSDFQDEERRRVTACWWIFHIRSMQQANMHPAEDSATQEAVEQQVEQEVTKLPDVTDLPLHLCLSPDPGQGE